MWSSSVPAAGRSAWTSSSRPRRWCSYRAYETFGLVVVEAQAHGVPAVVPRLGVFPGLLPDGRGGQLFSPGDVADLRAKVLR